ncbi:protein DOWNY MILDEW RESISTANCE 6-like [Elaeis guineensis]|uniref:protein DOWNY MILDEW RESISTANCE 6-like n=1 Tax=Elaeis guineensis var. tenera TaxID=51953 RepID=UPI003C6CF0DC
MEFPKISWKDARHGWEFNEKSVEQRSSLYSEDPFEMVRIATSYNMSKEEIAVSYPEEFRAMEARLHAFLCLDLGLEQEHLSHMFGVDHPRVMSLNHYPASPLARRWGMTECGSHPNAFVVDVGAILEAMLKHRRVAYRETYKSNNSLG